MRVMLPSIGRRGHPHGRLDGAIAPQLGVARTTRVGRHLAAPDLERQVPGMDSTAAATLARLPRGALDEPPAKLIPPAADQRSARPGGRLRRSRAGPCGTPEAQGCRMPVSGLLLFQLRRSPLSGRGLRHARKQSTTGAGHPYPHAVEAAVHFAATPVLLEERVEGLAECVHGRAKDSVVLGEAHRLFLNTRSRLTCDG